MDLQLESRIHSVHFSTPLQAATDLDFEKAVSLQILLLKVCLGLAWSWMAHQTPRFPQSFFGFHFQFQGSKSKDVTTSHSQSSSKVQVPFCVPNSNYMESPVKNPPVSYPSHFAVSTNMDGIAKVQSRFYWHLREWGCFFFEPGLLQAPTHANAEGLLQAPTQRTGLMLRGSPNRFSKDEVESSSPPPVFTWK